MNPRAGMALFAETGSLIARPQQIVPVIIVPATVLWVPVAAMSVPDVWPEQAALRFMNDRYFEPLPDVGQTWRNAPGIAPPLTLDAVRQTLENFSRDVGPVPPGTHLSEVAHWPVDFLAPEIPWRSEVSRITFLAPPADLSMIQRRMDEYEDRLFESLFGPRVSVPNLGQHTPADDDLVATLLDFAREGDADGFRALAEMRGVPSAEIPAMWDGTVKRLGKAKPA